MHSTAEAKFLDNSASAVMALQKLAPQATVIPPSIDVCSWLPMGGSTFKKHLSAKEA